MERHRNNFAAYWKLRFPAGEGGGRFGGDPGVGDADQFWLDMRMSSEGRCFVITKEGFVGLGPWVVETGDVLCRIPGAKVPYVLGKTDDVDGDGSYYRFIGEAFLHGLMRGEVHGLIASRGLQEETIIIV